MRRTRRIAALLALAAGGASDGPVLRPGEWETATTITAATVPGFAGFLTRRLLGTKTTRRCVASAADGGVWQAFTAKGCVAADPRTAGDGFSVDLVCGAYHTRITGRATPDRLDGLGATTRLGSALDIRATFVSRRIGDCSTSTKGKPR